MKTNVLRAGWFLFVLVFTLASSVTAQSIRVGGGLRPGFARPPLHLSLRPFDAASDLGPYSPAQIRHAYGIDQLLAAGATGRGQKIGIVDAYGDPGIQTDLNNFCSYYGIASTTVQVVYPQGKPRSGNSGWALETALDVEWAHAIAPDATIILSVAKSASLNDLLGAVDAAVNAGAKVVSMSWGATESAGINAYDSHFQVPGVTFVASSGDSGELPAPYEVEWPASSPDVLSVGGTTLYLDANGNYAYETGWSTSGGGISSVYPSQAWEASWQAAFNSMPGMDWTAGRGVPDVSYVADPNTGVGVAYGRNLYEVGGTSVGAPQWAALIALANQAWNTSGWANADIYTAAGTAPTINAAAFFDLTSGNNGTDADDYAVAGYDLVTGLGSPSAAGLVTALIPPPPQPDFSLTASPASQSVKRGQSTTLQVAVAAANSFSGKVALSVSGLPGRTSASFNPTSVSVSSSSPGSSTLTISTSSKTSTGTYTLTLTGAAGSLAHTMTVSLKVTR